jgi:hypothetical protein
MSDWWLLLESCSIEHEQPVDVRHVGQSALRGFAGPPQTVITLTFSGPTPEYSNLRSLEVASNQSQSDGGVALLVLLAAVVSGAEHTDMRRMLEAQLVAMDERLQQ